LECQQSSHQPDFEERQILDNLVDLLSDADITYAKNASLAAEVIKLWADFFDDTWVWGSTFSHKLSLLPWTQLTINTIVTPRMGAVMRAVASICEKDRKARTTLSYINELLPY
jgi:hypothetical protein